MASQLAVYNKALRLLGEPRLTGLTEARPARYHLDDAYALLIDYCLEQGYWNFAMRTAQLDASDSVEPAFGYSFAFTKPDDWIRTYLISPSETLDPPLLGRQLVDEAGYWYADSDPLFIKYVSNDTSYGADLALWPASFEHYAACHLALDAGPSVCTLSADKLEELERKEDRARRKARSIDATNEPTLFPPMGNWARARLGRSTGRVRPNAIED